jgi:hypothetical protein
MALAGNLTALLAIISITFGYFLWVAVSLFAKCLIAQLSALLIQGHVKNIIKINYLRSEYEINNTNLGENAHK